MPKDPCSFNFVYTNFADNKALFHNFRQLEDHLNRIGCGGTWIGPAWVGATFTDPWTPGAILWDTSSEVDTNGLIGSYSGTGNRYIHVAATGTYFFIADVETGYDYVGAAGTMGWTKYMTNVIHTDSGGTGKRIYTTSDLIIGDGDQGGIVYNDVSLSGVFVVTDTTDRIWVSSSPYYSSNNSSSVLTGPFLSGGDSTPSVSEGTAIRLWKMFS